MAEINVLNDNYPSLIQHFDLSETINENNILLDKSFNKNNSLKVTNPPTIEYDENLKRNVSVFNGTSNYIPIGKASKVTDAITINVLAYMDNWNNRKGGRIISCTENGGWNFFEDSKYSFYIHINGTFSTYSLPIAHLINGWNMITMSFNGYDIKYYMNGVLINTINVSATKQSLTYNSSNGVFIGAEAVSDTTTPSASQGYFKGKMADIRIYNEALSDDNVKKLFKSFNINRNIGERLPYPDSGWKRIDDTDDNIVFNGTWNTQESSNYYNSSSRYTNENTAYISFKYYGTKIRLLMIYYSTKADGNVIEIDGTKYYFNCSNSLSSGNGISNLAFEKTGLNKKVHVVKIYAPNASASKSIHIDAIDIDDEGYLIEPRVYGERYTTFDESVWQRIDDTNEYIQYIGTDWDKYNVSVTTMGSYNNSRHASCVKDDYTTFKVYTSKIRIYVNLYHDNTDIDSHDIYIDGKLVKSFSSYKKDVTDMSTAGQRLIYENLQMEKKEHTITLKNNQTNSTSWLMPDCFEIDSDGYILAPDRKIGDSLINPDPTWIRIDDTNEKIIYGKGWQSYNSGDLYGNSHHQTNILNESATFYFYGSKLRIVNSVNSDRTKNIKLTIDDNIYYYSEYLNSVKYKILVFEQCNLKNTFHKVKITNTENKYITLDCIDIDEHGYLLTEEEYNQYIKEQKKNDISINKTLKANLPSSTTKGIEIHFTEDGEMYVNKQDGSFIKVNSSYKTYSSEETYNINDYVVYNNKLYKCIENITVAEDFNVSKWQIVLEGAKGDPGEKGLDAANISKLYCKDNNLYVDFDNDTTKQIENFSLNKAVNEQIEYGQFGFNNTIEQISTLDTLIPFKTKVGNMALNSDGTITLTKGKTYKLSCYFRIDDTNTLKALSIKQNEKFLFNVVAQASEITETCTSVYIFTPTENAKVGLYTTSISIQLPTLTSVAFYNNTKLIVEEIAQPVVNNINYTLDDINNQTNIEDTPIGHIISFMGTKAPDHYLICDGSEYNITDYQKLADFFKEQFGSYNYFGGDGITTFALPNIGSHSEEDKWTADDKYIFSEAGAFCNIGGRTYYKCNVGKAIVAVVQSSDNTIYSMIVSTNPEYVKCYCSYNTSVVDSYLPDTIEYNGFTWYIGRANYGWNVIQDNSGFAQKVISKFPYKEYTNIAKELLDIAKVKRVSVETKCIKYEHTYYANIVNTITETVLYEGFANSGDISLTDNVKNYDYIEIYGCTSGSPKDKLGGHSSMIRVRVDEIDTFREYCCVTDSSEDAYGITYFLSTTWYWCIKIKGFSDDTTLSIDNANSNGWPTCGIYKIIGIKY